LIISVGDALVLCAVCPKFFVVLSPFVEALFEEDDIGDEWSFIDDVKSSVKDDDDDLAFLDGDGSRGGGEVNGCGSKDNVKSKPTMTKDLDLLDGVDEGDQDVAELMFEDHKEQDIIQQEEMGFDDGDIEEELMMLKVEDVEEDFEESEDEAVEEKEDPEKISLRQEVSSLKVDNDDLRARAELLAQRVADMEAEVAELKTEKSLLQKEISLLNTQIKTEQTTVKGLEEELKERGERPQSPEIDELKANLSKEKEEVCHLKQQIMEKDTRIRELMKQLENKEKILADDERAPEVGDNRHSRKTSTKIAEAMKRFSSTGALVGNEEKTKVTKTTKPKATAKPVQSDRTRPTSGKDSTHSQRPTSGKIKTTTTTTTSVRSKTATKKTTNDVVTSKEPRTPTSPLSPAPPKEIPEVTSPAPPSPVSNKRSLSKDAEEHPQQPPEEDDKVR
jgi:hypothetical protein